MKNNLIRTGFTVIFFVLRYFLKRLIKQLSVNNVIMIRNVITMFDQIIILYQYLTIFSTIETSHFLSNH